MNLYFSKVYIFLLLIICRLISGLCPLLISKKFKRKNGFRDVNKKWVEKCVSYTMDFSGGILLATCFIHMIPEVREHLLETLKEKYVFPFTETLVCVGFFIIYVIEELVKHVLEGKTLSERMEKPGALITSKNRDTSFGEISRNDKEMVDIRDSASNGVPMASTNRLGTDLNSVIKDSGNECNNNTRRLGAQNLKYFLLISALSFHSVMEGLAIGLASNIQDVWYLFLAVTVHECTILLCVGIELVASCSCASTVITYMAVLALVSPIGVLIGTFITVFVSETGSTMGELYFVSSLQGLAAGTILYVTFFEVLNNHKHHHHHHGEKHHQSESGLPKLVFIAMGFIFMIVFELTKFVGNYSSENGKSFAFMRC